MEQYTKAMQEEFIRRFLAPAAPRARGRRRRGRKNGKETGKRNRRKRKEKLGVTKAPQWVLLWILLGTRMQMVKAVEEEISTRQETDCMPEKVPVPSRGRRNKVDVG